MKKIVVCLLLALCVLCSLCVTVSAEGEAPDGAVSAADAPADEAPADADDLAAAPEAASDTADKAAEYGDMGGAFSPERLALAGQMVLEGLGLVFLALAILWGVLVIFRKVMYDAPQKKAERAAAKAAAAPAASPAVDDAVPAAPAAPAEDDGAVVAAITAAIAAAIASDEALSAEFKGGFRVVSFKKKNGGAAWNR